MYLSTTNEKIIKLVRLLLPIISHENDTQVMLKLAGMESGKKHVDPTPLSSCFHQIKYVEGVKSTSLDNGCT